MAQYDYRITPQEIANRGTDIINAANSVGALNDLDWLTGYAASRVRSWNSKETKVLMDDIDTIKADLKKLREKMERYGMRMQSLGTIYDMADDKLLEHVKGDFRQQLETTYITKPSIRG